MTLPADYVEALTDLAAGFAAYREETGVLPVLVGGAATAIRTDGAFQSPDFDVVASDDDAFARAMQGAGWIPGEGLGHLAGGFSHPRLPYFAEQVTPPLFDGRADPERTMRLTFAGGGEIALPSIEDLIADRLAQHSIAGGDDSRLLQAQALFTMAKDLDRHYLARRIVEEGGNPALVGL